MTTQISNETFTVTAPFLIAAMLCWVGAEALSAAGIVVTRHLTSPGFVRDRKSAPTFGPCF